MHFYVPHINHNMMAPKDMKYILLMSACKILVPKKKLVDMNANFWCLM